MSEREMRVSQRELHRRHVVRLTLEGRESVGGGAKLLGISARQMKRLRRKISEGAKVWFTTTAAGGLEQDCLRQPHDKTLQ